jgi:GAF domain-containing protein
MKHAPSPDPWNLLALQDAETVRFAMDQLVRAALGVLRADQGSLLLAEPRAKRLRFAMVVDARSDAALPAADALVGSAVPYGEGVTGMAALTHDVQSAAAADGAAFYRIHGDGSPSAVLAAPLLSGDRLLGVLTAVSFDPRRAFSPDDARLYGIFANLAAIVIDQQRRLDLLSSPKSSPPAVPGPEADERALLEAVLAFARARPGRAQTLLAILADLARLP